MCYIRIILVVLVCTHATHSYAESVEDYFAFNGPETGIILPAQITNDLFKDIHFIDIRSPEEFATASIHGAENLPWSEAITERNNLPMDKKVVLYCQTGIQSAQIMLGLRLLGIDVSVLQGGYSGWIKEKS